MKAIIDPTINELIEAIIVPIQFEINPLDKY